MEVIIRWVVDYLLTSCPVWRGTLPDAYTYNALPSMFVYNEQSVYTDDVSS